jgi:DNA adenine methylase
VPLVRRSLARSPFPWFGGKQKLADEILALFPGHNVYVEVFGGGGSVLLSKPPGKLDVYNDADEGLVNFFRCLRDAPERLVPLLELTPYSRAEWLAARASWRSIDDPVERARQWFVVASQSFGGMVAPDRGGDRAHDLGRGWGGERLGRMHLSRCASTANRVDHIWRFVERMRRVQIECLEWRECLDRYDDVDALFYLDPPYVPATRRSGGYVHELTAADHEDLVRRVLDLQGIAVVSGYDHELYAPLVERGDFTRHEFSVISTAGQRAADQARDRRVEVVWASPRATMPTLFDRLAVA